MLKFVHFDKTFPVFVKGGGTVWLLYIDVPFKFSSHTHFTKELYCTYYVVIMDPLLVQNHFCHHYWLTHWPQEIQWWSLSSLVQVMACCWMAPCHSLTLSWYSSLSFSHWNVSYISRSGCLEAHHHRSHQQPWVPLAEAASDGLNGRDIADEQDRGVRHVWASHWHWETEEIPASSGQEEGNPQGWTINPLWSSDAINSDRDLNQR